MTRKVSESDATRRSFWSPSRRSPKFSEGTLGLARIPTRRNTWWWAWLVVKLFVSAGFLDCCYYIPRGPKSRLLTSPPPDFARLKSPFVRCLDNCLFCIFQNCSSSNETCRVFRPVVGFCTFQNSPMVQVWDKIENKIWYFVGQLNFANFGYFK